MGSRATGMTRASVATSRASVASTAALNRIKELETERRKRQEIETQLTEIQAVVKQAAAK